MTHRVKLLAGSMLVASLALCINQAAEARPGPVTPRVFPPSSRPYGHTYGEWSAMYFQTEFANVWNPTACSSGRIGNVELLQATLGGPGEWECEVPAGTAFLWPVISAFFLCPTDCGPGGAAPNGTVEELRAAAAAAIESPTIVMECQIDGVPVSDLGRYRTQSPVFSGEIVEGCVFNAVAPEFFPPGPYGPAVADGFWVMATPLSVGEHLIHFRAVVEDPPGTPVFETESTHRITVLRGRAGEGGDALAVEPSTWGAIKATYR